MKIKLLTIGLAILVASCSSPKYTYKFGYHDYNAGRKDKQAQKEVAANPGPVEIQPEMLVAEAPVVSPLTSTQTEVTSPSSSPLTLSKTERKEMVKELKTMIKEVVKLKKADDKDHGKKAMDHDLKLSLIFFLVAILGGVLIPVSPYLAYVVVTVAFILAIVFFVKWLIRQ